MQKLLRKIPSTWWCTGCRGGGGGRGGITTTDLVGTHPFSSGFCRCLGECGPPAFWDLERHTMMPVVGGSPAGRSTEKAAAQLVLQEALWAPRGGRACAVRQRAGGRPPEPGSRVAHVGAGEGRPWLGYLVVGSLSRESRLFVL